MQVKAEIEIVEIPTYAEPPREDLPMFAENRVHQRTSGRPYPNKVVMRVDHEHREEKKYTAVHMENEYLDVMILPEIGGRIYSACDKTTGYDFFYKQHVIKPALIGVLGSWISGGVEFNWPFHHRASGFMPCDYTIEHEKDGSAICWLSEHDPMDRMKGMFGIVLRPGCTYIETRMRLYNRTDTEHSFLWWENAAVPVNEQYQIFFPKDVTYVNFHYLKSRISYPIAGNGVFNGIAMNEARDISMHKNTREATSYFAAASRFDFFGGYDHGKECGVVHIGDHHLSPGKKMFTWGYNQLSKSWENALTDTDGQYAELMAGSYSDNQPDFSWIEPYETKQFSQYWYPISKIGIPTYANLHCAVHIEHEGENVLVKVQSTEIYRNAEITVSSDNNTQTVKTDLDPTVAYEFVAENMGETVSIYVRFGGRVVAEYSEQVYDKFNMPEVITDMPMASSMESADELYMAGLHVDQYRDPAVEPDAYWKEALRRDPNHAASLLAMARYEYNRYSFVEAKAYAERAIDRLCTYNTRLKSGEAYYTYGKILEALNEIEKAYDNYYKAAWAADCACKAMTRIAVLDIRNGDYKKAVRHADVALSYNSNNSLAAAAKAIALTELGEKSLANVVVEAVLNRDPLDHHVRFISGKEDFYTAMDSSASQTCFDIMADLDAMRRYEDIVRLLEGLCSQRSDEANKLVYYALAYYYDKLGRNEEITYLKANAAELGNTYPFRSIEIAILERAISRNNDKEAMMLLGCLLYNKRQYQRALELWEKAGDGYMVLRNKAVAYFSHFDRGEEALELMKKALAMRPDDEQLLYETITLMDKLGTDPAEKINLIFKHKVTRDDIRTELAKALNQNGQHQLAEQTLLSYDFTPCEGGEHAIADQYIAAHMFMGGEKYANGDYEGALAMFRSGQIIPQNMGAGIWNHCKLIPLRYNEAICLEKLGREEEAKAIFKYIIGTKIEYFSNMHLKELPYYQAKAAQQIGMPLVGQTLITKYMREWEKIKDGIDNGFFNTTPFFISFVDNASKLRYAQYLYLEGLCKLYIGEEETATAMLSESYKLNNDNLMALYILKYGM